jgi:hypothetical protein
VDVYINSLRTKIDQGFSRPLIHTARGIGYMLAHLEDNEKSRFLPVPSQRLRRFIPAKIEVNRRNEQ